MITAKLICIKANGTLKKGVGRGETWDLDAFRNYDRVNEYSGIQFKMYLDTDFLGMIDQSGSYG